MKRSGKVALLSVYDKSNLEKLVSCLTKNGYDLIASGNTAARIRQLGYVVRDVSELTGFPESPGGLLKTLHPKIHGGFLLDPSKDEDKKYMKEQGITSIHLLVSNLYPFQEVARRKGVTLLEATRNIDIGGPTLIRSAAKGALLKGDVVVVSSPTQYESVIEMMEKNSGSVNREKIVDLAAEAFQLTQRYDAAIHRYLSQLGEE